MAKSAINTAGSRAGRGFRYQDAVAALLAVRGWAGVSGFGKITPEANDDCDLESDKATVFAQIKSRRGEAGPFAVAATAGHVLELWDRYDAAAAPPDELWLILERPFKGAPPLDTPSALPAALLAAAKLRDDPRLAALSNKTRIVVVPAPMDEAIALIAHTLSCTPAEGSIHYAEVLKTVGRLSDDNGVAGPGAYGAITRTDVTALIDAMRGLIALGDMDAALRDGVAEAIDFLTPIDDPDFYLGVDVEPGHLAAGLVAERPSARADIIAALEGRGQALVAGPSGAGKSALMWDAASVTRHVIRWYRVRSATEAAAPALARLARALRASAATPVGFVFDDVGGDLRAAWDGLSRQVPAASGVVLLGSIREEDLFLLEGRARIAEIRADADDALAERLWTELRERGATTWAGWREPWSISGGLMLEFAHILTQGERMTAVLAGQVDRRQREGRDLELSVLRVSSFAGASSALVDPARLAKQLGATEADVGRALRRLVDEHLVRETRQGLVGGLHQLRSRHLLALTHRSPPPTLAQTVTDAVAAIPAASLEALVANAALGDSELEALLDALATRLGDEPGAEVASAAFRGLGERHIQATLTAWVPTVLARGIVPTQVSTAVMFGIAGTQPIDLPGLAALNAAAADLSAAHAADPRASLLGRLSEATLEALAGAALVDVESLFASVIGIDAAALLAPLRRRSVDVSAEPLDQAVRLLGTIALHDRALANAIVATAGQDALLARLHAETPWTSPFVLGDATDGRVVTGEVRFVAPSVQTDVHAEVVAVIDRLFALAPNADIAAVSAIAPDGEPAGLPQLPLAVNRMSRDAAPAEALPRWNRRWMTATAALLGAKSYTEFLERGYAGLSLGEAAFQAFMERYLRGKVDAKTLARFDEPMEIAQNLTSPGPAVAIEGAPAAGNGAYVSDLQSLIHDLPSDLPRRFNQLPEGHAAFLSWTNGLLDQIERVRLEPWSLTGRDPVVLLDRLRDTVLALQVIAGEAGRRCGQPAALWSVDIRKARPGNALRLVAHQAAAARSRQLAALETAIAKALDGLGLKGEVDVRAERDVSVSWPFASVVIVLDIEDPADFIPLLIEHWDALRAAAGEGRSLTLVPRVDGLIVSRRAIGGYDTPVPRPGSEDQRLRDAGYLLLDERQLVRLGALIDAMYEVDGIRQFGYGVTGRPAIEATTLVAAVARRDDALEALADGVRDKLPDLPASLAEFVRLTDSGDIAFAEGLAATMHGFRSPVAEQIERLQAIALDLDLNAHTERLAVGSAVR